LLACSDPFAGVSRKQIPPLRCGMTVSGTMTDTRRLLFKKELRVRRTCAYFSSFFLLRARTVNQMGEPMNLKLARIWFSRKRS
jgi:hypothetical protein